MPDIWLVRHGATEWSQNGRHTSVTDLPLLPEGEQEARKLAHPLHEQSFALVLSSPLRRAADTARLAGFTPEYSDDLIEWRYGPGEGLTTPQIQEQVPGWRIWTHGAPDLPGEPGESREQMTARLTRLITRLRAVEGERVLLFGHGHCLRALAAVWCGLEIGAGAHFPLRTGSLSVLGYEKTTSALVRWNV